MFQLKIFVSLTIITTVLTVNHQHDSIDHLKPISVFDETANNIQHDEDLDRGQLAEERINLSFPGTRWCGPGNTASSYEELGQFEDTDRCCRDHDHCDNIAAGETKYNLTNNDLFTRLHCRCDQEFKECLRTTHNKVSTKIGYTYFSVRDRCYMKEHPIKGCQKHEIRFFLRRCVKYILDASQPTVYQWFDLPFYGSSEDHLERC